MTDIPPGGVKVTAKPPPAVLSRRGTQYNVEFNVTDSSGNVLGDLVVSKGGLDWRPRHQQSPYQASWAQFVKWMEGKA